MQENNLAG